MIDTVRLSFAALREVAPPDERSLRVDGINPGVYLGLDPAGKHHLLVESPDPPIRPSGVAALSTTHRELKIGSQLKRYLDVTCEHDDLVEVFHHFIAAVFERISVDAPDNGHVVMRTLAVWREFFSPATGRPSPDTVTGVIGELLFLRDLARVASSDGIAAWTGPKGGRHDFRSGDVALEVKTTRAHTRRVISVSGEEQFVPPDGGTLYLHFLRLEESPGTGVSLLDLIDEIVSTGVPRSELLAGLAGAGIPPSALSTVGTAWFDVRERLTLPVDDRMPRITPATFSAGRRPAGILGINYRVDLDHAIEHALPPNEYEALVRQFLPSARAS